MIIKPKTECMKTDCKYYNYSPCFHCKYNARTAPHISCMLFAGQRCIEKRPCTRCKLLKDTHKRTACKQCVSWRIRGCDDCISFTGLHPQDLVNSRYYALPADVSGKLAYRKYGLTAEQRDILRFEIQQGRCGICGQKHQQLHLDTTGIYKRERARGYLCTICLHRLRGYENAGWQEKMKAYLADSPAHRLRDVY